MALYRYFKPVSKKLPDPEGPLFQSTLSASIKDANEAYLKVAARSDASKRGAWHRNRWQIKDIFRGTYPTMCASFITATAYRS